MLESLTIGWLIGAAIGAAIFFTVKPSASAAGASRWGRNTAAWIGFWYSVIFIHRAISQGLVNGGAAFLVQIIFALGIGYLLGAAAYWIFRGTKKAKEAAPGVLHAVTTPKSTFTTQPAQPATREISELENIEDRTYAQVGEELESGNTDKGIWTKAFAQAGGDDKQTRVLYIQARVAKLLALEDEKQKIRLDEEQAAADEQALLAVEQARLDKLSLKEKLSTGVIGREEAEREVGERKTGFLLAIRNGERSFVEIMVGAFPLLLAVRNSQGDTCLHIATREMQIEIIKFLIEQGAYIDARNDEGETASDIARFQKLPKLIALFDEIESGQRES